MGSSFRSRFTTATVTYGVNKRGRVFGLDLLEKEMVSEEVSKSPVRLLRRIKAKTFRPRMEDGELVATEAGSLRSRGAAIGQPELGMMVEVPSAAHCIDQFDADLFSIGSN